ncbi:MAG: RNA-guided endonuclease InsQ/TnpB family protein, partial [Candidatus Odinarchaeia archaeon]
RKTIIFPVHRETTKKKLNYLNRLTARLSYATNLFLDFIEKNDTIKLSDLNRYKKKIKEITQLNSAHLQQCYMKARKVWKSYKKVKGKKSPPKFKNKKIPVWQDKRTFEFIEWKEGKLSRYWIKITTLKPREKIMLPFDYGYYQLRELKETKVKSVAFVKRNKRFYVHVVIEKDESKIRAKRILAIDLGIRRKATAVLLSPSLNFTKRDILIFREGKRLALIHKAEQYYSKIQSLGKWRVVKRIKNLRKTHKHEYDHIVSKRVVEIAEKNRAIMVIGYPKYCRNKHRKGNRNKKLRKIVNSWSFQRLIQMIKYKCEERGLPCLVINEAWTSKTCHRCNSRNTKRPYQSLFKCLDCGLEYNADINSAVNIGVRVGSLIPTGCCEPAVTNNDRAEEALEIRSSLRKLGAVHL